MTTQDIDDLAERFIEERNVIPAFKGYRGFPATLCVSLNDVIVHGIPNQRTVLRAGDIVSVDCGDCLVFPSGNSW